MDLSVTTDSTPERRRYMIAGVVALLVGIIAGVGLLQLGAFTTLALFGAAFTGAAYLRSVWVSFAGMIAVLCLLPFAVIPFSTPAGTPALIELSIFASLVIVGAVVLCDRTVGLPVGAAQSLWLGLVGMTGFAFMLGYGRGYTTDTLHSFAKFLLGLACFVLILILVRRTQDVVLVVQMLLTGISVAAGIALALYAGGPALTQRVLTKLVPYGYPGTEIVRYIESNPGRPMRATGTGVDPNAFGGLIMVGFVLAAGQLFGRNPVVSRWWSGPAFGLCAMTMLVTFSRGAWVGAAAGLFVILIVRRRAWLPVLGALGAAAVALGIGSGFVERLWLGFTLQDPATRLRLQEYQNALEIIQRHPWLGVGFGDAGSVDLQTGVSSIYLTIAEQAGLIGLATFLVAVGWIVVIGFREIYRTRRGPHSDLLLTTVAAFSAMLTVGLVDHYFFNIRFPHMAALFWIVAGLIVALTRLAATGSARGPGELEGTIVGEIS